MNDTSPRAMALRALRDCGVIRTTDRNRAYMDLWHDCLADFVNMPPQSALYKRDNAPDYPGKWRKYRLTEAGKALAAQLKPWGAPE
jgi:hypothetical protein